MAEQSTLTRKPWTKHSKSVFVPDMAALVEAARLSRVNTLTRSDLWSLVEFDNLSGEYGVIQRV